MSVALVVTDADDDARRPVEADHKPALAAHWVSTGYDAPYQDRFLHAKAGVRPINEKENKKLVWGGVEFRNQSFAGPKFTSKGTEKYGKWWCTEDTPFKNAPPNPPKNK